MPGNRNGEENKLSCEGPFSSLRASRIPKSVPHVLLDANCHSRVTFATEPQPDELIYMSAGKCVNSFV
jgi:hypothetical protein